MEEQLQYKSLQVKQKSPGSGVYYLHLNRPTRGNALSLDFFTEFPAALSSLDRNPNAAVVILSGAGNHFCSGIDLQVISNVQSVEKQSTDSARTGEWLRRNIKFLQRAVTAIEEFRKPVIAAVHGACVGAGVDLITACDIRYCTESAFFVVKEVDLGITADLGSLQRLPGIVGFGNAMELALTGRRFSGSEAKELGLVSRVFSNKESLEEGVAQIAEDIAAKSPLAVVGTKRVLIQSRDMTLDQGLDYIATWNSGVILSDDLTEAISAQRQKRKPKFSKL
ncbi:hypothetical protein RD792_008714 [Penstemon davidsonii]|uniref:Uncharacterized protein n=1 Tax=Penstemon davidsonii TaxID=160366 RepID=A0ABR0DAS2_9LAMI|nr:hypothetical protein RD792_008714 [Penstemon davidsonii]